jgi:hypothetical protein
MRLARALAPLLLLALAQCASEVLPPYATVPPPLTREEQRAAESGESFTLVAVCYNAFTTTAARVRAIAAGSCAAGTTLHPITRDFDLAVCPLFEPARATFACTKS